MQEGWHLCVHTQRCLVFTIASALSAGAFPPVPFCRCLQPRRNHDYEVRGSPSQLKRCSTQSSSPLPRLFLGLKRRHVGGLDRVGNLFGAAHEGILDERSTLRSWIVAYTTYRIQRSPLYSSTISYEMLNPVQCTFMRRTKEIVDPVQCTIVERLKIDLPFCERFACTNEHAAKCRPSASYPSLVPRALPLVSPPAVASRLVEFT